MKKILKVYLGFLVIFLAALLSFFIFGDLEEYSKKQEAGVNNRSISFGTSMPLTGQASFASEYYYGGLAYLKKINDEGGVYGRKIMSIIYDDMYDPAKTVANTHRLISQDQVFALFNYVGTPTGIKALPIINEAKIPLVGLGTGAEVFRNPLQPYIFNLRASYHEEAEAFIKGVVEDLKMTKIAVFYQFDDYGFDGLKGAEAALAKYGLKPVAVASYQRGSLDVEAAAESIKSSHADAVFMVCLHAPAAKFIKIVKSKEYDPIFGNLSFVGSEALAAELGAVGNGVVVTQAVPPQVEKNILPGVDEYVETLKKYYPGKAASFISLEGYLSAKVMVEGLVRAGPHPTREKFIRSLESIRKYSLDIAATVNLSRENHQGINRVYLTYIKDGKFVLFNDWQEVVKGKK